jgi:hypothetical protein
MIVTIEEEDYPQLLKPYSANIEDGSYNLELEFLDDYGKSMEIKQIKAKWVKLPEPEMTVEWIDGGFFDEYEDED